MTYLGDTLFATVPEEPVKWIDGQDDDGLPFFTGAAFEVFLRDRILMPGGVLEADEYRCAREQLLAIREGLE